VVTPRVGIASSSVRVERLQPVLDSRVVNVAGSKPGLLEECNQNVHSPPRTLGDFEQM